MAIPISANDNFKRIFDNSLKTISSLLDKFSFSFLANPGTKNSPVSFFLANYRSSTTTFAFTFKANSFFKNVST